VDQTVVLVPLLCLKCSSSLPAEPDQVAWVCPVCNQANYLDDELGLQPLEIFYAGSLAQNATGKPYWVADGQATMQRETFGSSKNNEAQQFWSQTRRFFIPAYRAPLENLLAQAANLLVNPPDLRAGARARFEPVTMDMKDIAAAAEFILIAVEAGRSDRLKKVDFQLKLSKPVLWILAA
jgi:hypothetical protein